MVENNRELVVMCEQSQIYLCDWQAGCASSKIQQFAVILCKLHVQAANVSCWLSITFKEIAKAKPKNVTLHQ
jgi:hypothetical protein